VAVGEELECLVHGELWTAILGNVLSRGCTAEDMVNTVILTVLQSAL